MSRVYQIAGKRDTRALQEFLVQNGQGLVPMVELIEQAQMAVQEFIDVLGRASLEAVLELSAAGMVGRFVSMGRGARVPVAGREQYSPRARGPGIGRVFLSRNPGFQWVRHK